MKAIVSLSGMKDFKNGNCLALNQKLIINFICLCLYDAKKSFMFQKPSYFETSSDVA